MEPLTRPWGPIDMPGLTLITSFLYSGKEKTCKLGLVFASLWNSCNDCLFLIRFQMLICSHVTYQVNMAAQPSPFTAQPYFKKANLICTSPSLHAFLSASSAFSSLWFIPLVHTSVIHHYKLAPCLFPHFSSSFCSFVFFPFFHSPQFFLAPSTYSTKAVRCRAMRTVFPVNDSGPIFISPSTELGDIHAWLWMDPWMPRPCSVIHSSCELLAASCLPQMAFQSLSSIFWLSFLSVLSSTVLCKP